MFGMENDPYFQTDVWNSTQKVMTEDWTDVEPSTSTTKFTIDCSRKVMWTLGKSEGNRIRTRLRVLLNKQPGDTITTEEILRFFIGPSSPIAEVMKKDLDLDDTTWLKFIHHTLLQAAYSQSVESLHKPNNRLKKDVMLSENELNALWKHMAKREYYYYYDIYKVVCPITGN